LPPTTSPLSLHDALPISAPRCQLPEILYPHGPDCPLQSSRSAVVRRQRQVPVPTEQVAQGFQVFGRRNRGFLGIRSFVDVPVSRSEEHTSELQSRFDLVC